MRIRPLKRLLVSKGDTYRTFMQDLLSYFLLTADSLLVIVYSIIVYKVRFQNKHNSVRGDKDHVTEIKVSLLCVFVAASFVLFTIPYALNRLATAKIQFWANIILVSNSGMNSVIYFFRNYCENRLERRRKKDAPTSSGFTPMSTPLSSRHNVSESVNNSPHLTLKSDEKRRLGGSPEIISLGSIKSVSYTHLTLPTICSV